MNISPDHRYIRAIMSEPTVQSDNTTDDELQNAYRTALRKRIQLIEELYQLNCKFADVQQEIRFYEAKLGKTLTQKA